jgi:hypothetical protein
MEAPRLLFDTTTNDSPLPKQKHVESSNMAAPESTEASQQKYQLLSATYQSPTNEPFKHVQKLPARATTKITDRTSYLAALRKATAQMQETINKELTSRMEEDKAREAASNNSSKVNGAKVDEAKEEDNYGEEVAEEED